MSTSELERPSRRSLARRATDRRELPACQVPRRNMQPGPSEAVGDAEVAALFPAVRRSDDISAALARRSVSEFDPRVSATTWIVGRGLGLLAPADREGIIAGWRVHHRGYCPSLIADGGCDVRIGRSAVTDRVRAVLLEWLPLSRIDLAVYEGGLFRGAPANALSLLVRPPTIWSIDDAVAADRLFPRGRRFSPERFNAIERYAGRRIRIEQLTGLRAAARRIELQLPAGSLPVASATVAAGCAVIGADDEWCATIAAQQLARYATSAVVAASRRDCDLLDGAGRPTGRILAPAATVDSS